jgi:hypothetical protein
VKLTRDQIKKEMAWHLKETPQLSNKELDFIIKMCQAQYERGVIQGRKDVQTQLDAPTIKPESAV